MSAKSSTSDSLRTHPRIYCCSNGCLNSSIKKPQMSFFKLPRDEQRRNEWLRLLSREDLCDKNAKSYVVCEEHFHAHEILRAEHRKNLKKNAVPSLNLPGAQSNEVVAFEVLVRTNVGTQTDGTDKLINSPSSKSLKRKLKLKSKPNKKFRQKESPENPQKETFHKLCDRFLSQELAELVKVQTSAGNGRNKLSLSITTEINEKVMSILQIKAKNMVEKAKNCSLILNVMDLKPNLVYNTKEDRITGFHEVDGVQTPEPATAALVLMLRGIVFKWQQPIGFALLSEYRNYEEIWKWIDKLVSRLFDIGLHIRVFVSDVSADVYNLAKKRLVSSEKPFFFNINNKIFYVFDPPDLLRMLRDSLLVHDLNYQGRVANIDPVQEYYNLAKEKNCSMASSLTESHFKPDSVERKDDLLVVQLLSHTVAAAISTYIDFYVMDESARDTVKVIKLMNDLYNLLNSVSDVFSADSEQLQILAEAKTFFKSLKLVDRQNGQEVTSTARFIDGFQITISSVKMMLDDLKKQGIKFLRTRWLHRDLSEKLFSQIRSKSKVTGDPKSHQFVSAFRELLVIDLMKPPRGKDCSLEVAKFLADLKSQELVKTVDPEIDSKDFIHEMENNVKVKCSDYNNLELKHEHTVVFLSSFLLKRCGEKHMGCHVMKSHIRPQSETFDLDKNYQRYRDYSRLTKTSLLVAPTDDFIHHVEMMEQEFRKAFKKKHINKDIARSIYTDIKELSFSPPCPCFPTVYLKKLFIRMRIFHTIQFNNKKFQSLGSGRKYFSVPNL